MPAFFAFLAAISNIRSTAGLRESNIFDIEWFILSTAKVYCVKSLVPTLKKSTSFASSALIITDAGVSIIIPISTSLEKAMPSFDKSLLTCSIIDLICFTSSTEIIIGNIIASFPKVDARYNALS